MFHTAEEPSSGRLKMKISQVDPMKENMDLIGNSPAKRGPRSSGSKLGLSNLNLNVLSSNFARFEEKVASKGFDDDKENPSSTRSMTKIKARPSAATSYTKTSPEVVAGRKNSNDFFEEDPQDFSIPDFVSSVPQAIQDFPLKESSLPPLPSFYPPPPMFSLPSPLLPVSSSQLSHLRSLLASLLALCVLTVQLTSLHRDHRLGRAGGIHQAQAQLPGGARPQH